MTTAAPSTALATMQPAFTDAERLALAGFLTGYRGLTREAYALDLRQFTTWCRVRSLALFAARRDDIDRAVERLKSRIKPDSVVMLFFGGYGVQAGRESYMIPVDARRDDIESFARKLEARGRARATVTRRLSTIAGFYKYAVEEELLDQSPAAPVRRPRVAYESPADFRWCLETTCPPASASGGSHGFPAQIHAGRRPASQPRDPARARRRYTPGPSPVHARYMAAPPGPVHGASAGNLQGDDGALAHDLSGMLVAGPRLAAD